MAQAKICDKFEFPTTENFKLWVEESLVCLKLPPSAFLIDIDKPGSKNAVNVILRRTASIKLDSAKRLYCELHERADQMGVELPVLGS